MKNLIEISKIVTKKKVRKIEIFDSAALEARNSKFSEFYEALAANKFKNDRDAASFLYGCSPTHDKYRQLKSRFRKRLLNTLFFIDMNVPGASGYDRAYFTCNKDWTLVKILIANEANQTAEYLAKQILGIGLKFKFADVIVNCCRILRQYAAEAGNEADFEEYDRLVKQFSNILEAEIRSEELYQRTMLSYKISGTDINVLTEKILVYCDALVGLSEEYDSPIVNYNMYLVWTFRYEMQRDYPSMLQVCSQAEQFIENNPDYLQEEKIAAFHLKKMTAYLHMRDFKNGKVNAEKSLQIFPEGSPLWFLFMEYYLLLAFHTDNFINAMAILNRARSSSKFKKLDLETKEKWKVFEVYLNYFIEETDQSEELKAQTKKNFKLSRFLNDSILYPKEQRVFTIHMLIAQLLFLIDKKNFTEARDRIDRLKSYATKQLDKDEHFRMIQFIRLLQQLSKANFQISSLTNTEKYYNRLVDHSFFYRGLLNELEVIPFEKLWNYILKKLQ
jgi:tellurite resistance protein